MTRKNTPTRTVVSLSALALIAAVGGGLLLAGPLDPPAGPVTSTYKTLSEVEPRIAINAANTPGDADSLYKITQPGSYYLTGNITGVVGKHGVEIIASGVALDLNGFDLVGVAGSLDGVSVTVAGLTNIAVVNGSVRNWGDEGVDLASLGVSNGRVEGVHASGNVGNGITVGTSCTVANCLAYQNTANGINTGNGGTVTNCSAYLNTATGILTGSGGTVTNCSAFDNSASGISTGNGSTITNCSASTNTSNGINTGFGCTVTDCSAQFNILDGIRCTSACVIRGNACSNNGNGGDGAGIHATLRDNRIEGNNCIQADRGIDVDDLGNIIIQNTCSGNTSNWEIAIGNSVGPIVVAGTNAAVISGIGPSPSTLGSTDPHANFSY